MKKIKNCFLCNTDKKIKTDKLCSDCVKIQVFIRNYGIILLLEFIMNTPKKSEEKEKIIIQPSAPYLPPHPHY